MKSFKKIVAVTIVTALCFIACCVPASASAPSLEVSLYEYLDKGLMIPSPTFPDAESLPYGSDTLVYDMIQRANNGLVFYRLYLKNVQGDGSVDSLSKGSTAFLSYSSSDYFHFLVMCPEYPIYYENLFFLDDDNYTTVYSSGLTKNNNFVMLDGVKVYSNSLYGTFSSYTGEYFHLMSYPLYFNGCQANSTFFFNGNAVTSDVVNSIPADLWNACDIMNSVPLKPTIRGYVTTAQRDEMLNDKVIDSIDNIGDVLQDSFDEVIENNNANTDKITGSIDSASGEIQTAIDGAVDDIMNGASEVPTVDTDNSWMNESVTKVNEWLSELEAFEEQMKQNEEENSENMQQASNFINGFFDIIPTAVKAIVSLGLVMIVVIKIVGR